MKSHIYHDGNTYVFGVEKVMNHNIKGVVYIYDLYFYLTLKSSKKIRHCRNKADHHYTLVEKTDNELVNVLLIKIKDYLKNKKPEYINAFPAWDGNDILFEKRLRVYELFLKRNGYKHFLYDEEKRLNVFKINV